jgi:hypothetical protein
MNARLSKGNVLRTAKRILGLAGLAALALVCAGPARAQSNPAQTESTAARSAAAVPETSPGVGPSGSTPAAQQLVKGTVGFRGKPTGVLCSQPSISSNARHGFNRQFS